MNENVRTRLGRTEIQTLTELYKLEKLVKDLANVTVTLAVFNYRAASCIGDVVLSRADVNQRRFCEEVGADPDNHQLIVRYNTSSFVRENWAFYWFHDNAVHVTNDPENVRIFGRGNRG
jgi:hypothetical protein